MNKSGPLLLTLLAIVIASCYSCSQERAYPQELVMADSAYMAGKYQQADALLNECSKKIDWESEEDVNYFQLVNLEKLFVSSSLTDDNFSMIDSLCRYYVGSNEMDKYAKAVFYAGEVYLKAQNYPAALNCYLKARDIADTMNNNVLYYLICKNIGDLYFEQRMFDECIPYYKTYNEMATANNDTLRMAYGAVRMGRVYTIKSVVDSILFFYEKSIYLAESCHREDLFKPFAISYLCDIYVQLEQYDKALEIMPHDELNDANWAKWHYGQHHLDSAAYYFRRTLGRFKWQGEVEVLRNLALLERERGNIGASLDYYEQLAAAEDSLRAQQRTEETKSIEAQYNLSRIQQQRDELEQQGREMKSLAVHLGLVVIVLLLAALALWRMYVEKRRSSLFIQQRLEQEKKALEEQGRERQRENSERLAALEQQLEEARHQQDSQTSERLTRETRLLQAQNESIEAFQQRKESLLRELYSQAYCRRLKADDPSEEKKLSDEEWDDLARRLDDIYQNMTARLRRLGDFSQTELRICYLLKLEVKPIDIAVVLNKTRSAITHARKRMYRKLTGTGGTAEDFDALLLGL